jgi:hypothetical protein
LYVRARQRAPRRLPYQTPCRAACPGPRPRARRHGRGRITAKNRLNRNGHPALLLYRTEAEATNTSTRQGQPIGFNLTYGQMPAPLIGVSLKKYDIRIQTVREVTVRGCQSRASRVGQISRQFHRTSSRSTKHATDSRSPLGTPFKSPPSALATSCTHATARAIRDQHALSHRESLDPPISGQLRSSVIFVSNTKKTTFQIHHIAQSPDALFRLTMPRTRQGQPIECNLTHGQMPAPLRGVSV